MASASSLQISISIRCSSSTTHNNRLFPGGFSNLRPTFSLPQSSLPRSVLTCARRRSTKSSSPVPSSKKKKKNVSSKDVEVLGEEDLDDDAFEALFQQLAEDLKNDDLSLDDDDEEITDEELAKLEAELDEVLNDGELMGLFNSMVDDATEKEVKGNVEEEDEEEDELVEEDEEEDELVEEDEEEDELEEDDEEEDDSEVEETQVELRRWQLKRLAYALKLGRRKANDMASTRSASRRSGQRYTSRQSPLRYTSRQSPLHSGLRVNRLRHPTSPPPEYHPSSPRSQSPFRYYCPTIPLESDGSSIPYGGSGDRERLEVERDTYKAEAKSYSELTHRYQHEAEQAQEALR